MQEATCMFCFKALRRDVAGAWADDNNDIYCWGSMTGENVDERHVPKTKIACKFCTTPLRQDDHGTWIDDTEGDVCWGSVMGENEDEQHVPDVPSQRLDKDTLIQHLQGSHGAGFKVLPLSDWSMEWLNEAHFDDHTECPEGEGWQEGHGH